MAKTKSPKPEEKPNETTEIVETPVAPAADGPELSEADQLRDSLSNAHRENRELVAAAKEAEEKIKKLERKIKDLTGNCDALLMEQTVAQELLVEICGRRNELTGGTRPNDWYIGERIVRQAEEYCAEHNVGPNRKLTVKVTRPKTVETLDELLIK